MDAFNDFQAGRLGSIPASYVPHGPPSGARLARRRLVPITAISDLEGGPP